MRGHTLLDLFRAKDRPSRWHIPHVQLIPIHSPYFQVGSSHPEHTGTSRLLGGHNEVEEEVAWGSRTDDVGLLDVHNTSVRDGLVRTVVESWERLATLRRSMLAQTPLCLYVLV